MLDLPSGRRSVGCRDCCLKMMFLNTILVSESWSSKRTEGKHHAAENALASFRGRNRGTSCSTHFLFMFLHPRLNQGDESLGLIVLSLLDILFTKNLESLFGAQLALPESGPDRGRARHDDAM